MRTLNSSISPLATLALPALLALTACAGGERDIVNGPVYPTSPQGSVVNIQVLRDGTTATLTNTTVQTFTGARLWANQWYSLPLTSLKPGETITVDLAQFKDRYGNPFRAGGFWAVDNPEKLVLMQIEQGDKLTGLVVIGQAE
ncbi:MAG: hypothetical protein Q8L55_00240 [Phycisphaerales bacterium]|nr:hypothetical protein [Phycisphaerales bacterium]